MIDIKPKSVLEQPIYMLTKATPCPYLKGRVEKRIATDITYNNKVYNELASNGFRRVENWMYRPVCDNCSACKSYRVDIKKFELTKSLKRVVKNLRDIDYKIIKNTATTEHYNLFKEYQFERHSGGSMSDMDEKNNRKLEEYNVSKDLIEFSFLSKAMLVKLAENNIKTLEDFAGLTTDDLIGYLEDRSDKNSRVTGLFEEFNINKDEGDQLIMEARKIWLD